MKDPRLGRKKASPNKRNTDPSAAKKAANTKQKAKSIFESATARFAAEPDRAYACIKPGSKPGWIKLCKNDPNTGVCNYQCKEFPDPGGQMLKHVIG